MTDLANLVIAADSTQVDKARASLDLIADTSQRAETSIEQMVRAIREADAQYGHWAPTLKSATAALDQSKIKLDENTLAANKASAAIDTLARQQANLAKLQAAGWSPGMKLGGFDDLSKVNAGGALGALKSLGQEAGNVEKEVAKAGEGMASDFGKISLSALQVREVMVLLREGVRGDFTRMAGSASLLAGTFSAETLVMVGAIGAVLAPFALLVTAMAQGEHEATVFADKTKAMNNYLGESRGEVQAMANAIGNDVNIGVGKATTALNTLIFSGHASRDTLFNLADSAVRMAALTGESTEKMSSYFLKMNDGVEKFGIQFQLQYHLLDGALLQHVSELERTGQREEAARDLAAGIHEAIRKKGVEELGALEGAWRAFGNTMADIWQSMKNIGKEAPLEMQLASAKAHLADLTSNEGINWNPFGPNQAYVFEAKQRVASLEAQVAAQQKANAADAASAEIQRKGAEALEYTNGAMERFNKNADNAATHIARYRAAIADMVAAGMKAPSAHDQETVIAGIQRSYGERRAKQQSDHVGEHFQDQTDALTAEAKGALLVADAYDKDAAAVTRAEAIKKAYGAAVARNVDEQLTEARVLAQINIATATEASNIAKSVAAIDEHARAHALAASLVASGAATQSEANVIAERSITLEHQMAFALQSTGEAHAAIVREINRETEAWRQQDLAAYTDKVNANNLSLKERAASLRAEAEALQLDNRERAVYLAVEKAKLDLDRQGISRTSRAGLDYLHGVNVNAGQEYDNKQNQLNDPFAPGGQMAKQAIEEASFLINKRQRWKAAYDAIEQFRQADSRNDKVAQQAKRNLDIEILNERLDTAQKFFDQLSSLTKLKSKELQAIGKAAAIVSATIDMYKAVSKTYAETPYPWSIPLAVAVGVAQAANIAAIAGLKDGGPVSGPGGPKDDKVLRWLSNGEYVINAEATARNRPLLDAINGSSSAAQFRATNNSTHLANGGYVGGDSAMMGGHYFDFRGANFGGADPDQIEARFRRIMDREYTPKLVDLSVGKSLQAQKQVNKRQSLGGRR